MDLVSYFAREWHVIGQAPATFLIAATFVAGLAYAAASWRFGGIIETQVARIALLETKLENAPIAENMDKRRAIREHLASFLETAEQLNKRARTEPSVTIRPLVEKWGEEVRDWLNANLDASFGQQFLSSAGLNPIHLVGPMDEEQRTNASWIYYRSVRLQEFIQAHR